VTVLGCIGPLPARTWSTQRLIQSQSSTPLDSGRMPLRPLHCEETSVRLALRNTHLLRSNSVGRRPIETWAPPSGSGRRRRCSSANSKSREPKRQACLAEAWKRQGQNWNPDRHSRPRGRLAGSAVTSGAHWQCRRTT
jgi:hypothetical protein